MTTRVDDTGAAPEPGTAAVPIDPRITVFGLFVEASGRLSRHLSKEMEAECGIPITWFEVLLRLGRTPRRRMRMIELAHQISFTDSGVSRLADRMERAGLIGRELDRTDRRGTLAVLTPAGADLLDRAVQVHLDGIQRRVFDHLGDRDVAALERIMRTIREANGQD
jgi:DNA-binding MarR family transcriptional regulator